jgi:hypothetical protein
MRLGTLHLRLASSRCVARLRHGALRLAGARNAAPVCYILLLLHWIPSSGRSQRRIPPLQVLPRAAAQSYTTIHRFAQAAVATFAVAFVFRFYEKLQRHAVFTARAATIIAVAGCAAACCATHRMTIGICRHLMILLGISMRSHALEPPSRSMMSQMQGAMILCPMVMTVNVQLVSIQPLLPGWIGCLVAVYSSPHTDLQNYHTGIYAIGIAAQPTRCCCLIVPHRSAADMRFYCAQFQEPVPSNAPGASARRRTSNPSRADG